MPGLFGLLNLGAQSLQVQRQGVEVAGHNLANVNNPAYARQRLRIQTSMPIPTPIGPQGTGAQVTGIQQLRSAIVDGQIQAETSVRGFLDAKEAALQFGQAILGQTIDRQATGPEGTAASLGVGGQHGLAESLGDLFASFQSLSTNPTSLTERQSALTKAQDLATQFNQIDARLGDLNTSLDGTLQTDVSQANELLGQIADYNKQIFASENGTPGAANDLRDLRQQRIEELSKLVNAQATEQANGAVDISISGTTVVSGLQVLDTLETYDAGGGRMLVRTATGGTPLTLTGGSLQGVIDARDGALKSLRDDVNSLASLLITKVNTIHSAGFSLTGSTGAEFFTGTNAADIAVNASLLSDPSLLQASGTNGAVGDNQVALALSQLANQPNPSLNNRTFSQNYSQTVASLGQALASVTTEISDQTVVEQMLHRQRDSVSGVSLDEEMTDLIKFQKGFEASAHLITTIDEMLQTVLSMKR
jgi:flagellar hook-associated protein 1 FlgK